MKTVLAAVALIVLLGAFQGLLAQTIPLTPKLTELEGKWTHDISRGTGSICGVTFSNAVSFKVSATEVAITTDQFTGVFKLDGTLTTLSDGRTATAALDAGWLAVTMTRARNGGLANVMREVYIVLRGNLTIWRTLNVVLADGTQGKIDCGNHHAIVYTRN